MLSCSTMSQQIKELMRKYGKVAVGVHLGVYATTFAGNDLHASPQCAYAYFSACVALTLSGRSRPHQHFPLIGRMYLTLLPVRIAHANDVAASGIAGLYLAVQNKLDVESTLQDYGLLSSECFAPICHSILHHVLLLCHAPAACRPP